jgi:endonuclease/exonuclease/phosphatase family metal-dependent hydrolase
MLDEPDNSRSRRIAAVTDLSIVTINIWNRQGPWEERKRRLRAGLAALAPDIIAMQEVIRRGASSQADELTDHLGHHVAFGKARPLDAEADYGNAIASRFPIDEIDVRDIPCLDVDEPRSVLVVKLATPAGILPVLVTHYSWRMEHGFVREQQSLAIANVLDSLPADSLPPLFIGDLNAAPSENEIRFLVGEHAIEGRSLRLTDCFAAAGRGDGFTFDGRHNPFAEPWKEPPRRIDYIFVDGPDASGRGTPIEARVVLDELTDDIAPSDHYGVYARVRF